MHELLQSSWIYYVLGLLPLLYTESIGTGSTKTYDRIVRTESGRVGGKRHDLPSRETVEVYLGIPYAKPPVGYLRFRHPQPVERWNGVLNATALPNSCYQENDGQFGEFYGATVWNSPTLISEDCLYLNVFVPRNRARRKHKLPVMVWIYGGGFYSGTTTLGVYDGKILAAQGNVVVVSIGYRLGALGFLSLNNPNAPGNAGLFDQLMGLEWVRQNIEKFGGNADDVTLFGESAGSVSVSLHLLSPLSHGKFHRAILQSGAAIMPWATLSSDEGRRRAEELAFGYLQCNRTLDADAVVDCLRLIPASQIVEKQWISRGVLQFPFVPVIDGVFLTDSPLEILWHQNFKKCPIVIGSNRNEGSTFLIYELTDHLNLDRKRMTRGQYVDSITQLFHYYPQYPRQLSKRGIESITLQYLSHTTESDETVKNIYALDMAVGDSQFICPLNAFANAYAKAGLNVYMYYFTHRYSSNPWPPWMGVVHGDEIFFTLGEAVKPGNNFTEDERALSHKMMLYWSNFARSGDPNQTPSQVNLDEWPLHTPEGREYLELNLNILQNYDKRKSTGQGPRFKECVFWREKLPDLINSADFDEPIPTTVSSSVSTKRASSAVMSLFFLIFMTASDTTTNS